MKLHAIKTELRRILPLRAQFLQENNFQIRYNACHERGWSDSYLLTCDGGEAGYGSVRGQEVAGRDTVFEFYVKPALREHASALFHELLSASRVTFIECQSNDRLLSAMMAKFGHNVRSEVALFEAHTTTELAMPGVVFRPRSSSDRIFAHSGEPVGDHVLEAGGEVVATGGFLTHYNPPFADLYLEVAQPHRRKGLGAFLVQEIIKQCYAAGRVPAARCNAGNKASKATLVKAGLRECGFMLLGEVKRG